MNHLVSIVLLLALIAAVVAAVKFVTTALGLMLLVIVLGAALSLVFEMQPG